MLKSANNLDIGTPGKVHSTPIWMRVLNTIILWPLELFQAIGARYHRESFFYFTRQANPSTMLENCTTGCLSSLPRGQDFAFISDWLASFQLELELGLSLNPSLPEVGYQIISGQAISGKKGKACKRKLSKNKKASILARKRMPCAREEMKQIPFLFQLRNRRFRKVSTSEFQTRSYG